MASTPMVVDSPPKDQVLSPSSAPTNCEDYNVPSKERRALLLRLKISLEAELVPAHFWAACQVCDINMLKNFIKKQTMDITTTAILTGSAISLCKLNSLRFLKLYIINVL